MAQSTSKTFSILTALMALLLLGTAGVLLQQSRDGGGNTNAAIAALSQALPRHAASAVGGAVQGFDQFDRDVKRLSTMMQSNGGNLPGRRELWQSLENSARAVLGHRENFEGLYAAVASVNQQAPLLQDTVNSLANLGQTGATSLLRAFQERTERVRQTLAILPATNDVNQASAVITDDLAFLRKVVDALDGKSTDLDIAALTDQAREESLLPISNALAEIENQANAALALAVDRPDPDDLLMAISSAADEIMNAAYSAPASGNRSSLASLPWVWIGLGLLAAALLMLIGLGLMHARSAVFERTSMVQSQQNERNQQAILRLLDELGSLADGDLTVEATVTEDITGAIADSINYAIEKLRELVATINETAIMVDSAAKQTKSTAVHMAHAADNQASEINAATESIVSMARSIEEVSGNAERSSDVARHSVEVAHKGGAAVRRTIDGMNTIRETIQDTSKRIKRLGESSQEIGNIVELINDIAEQTNILALNASIQASMAGEAGRGFAVVADEVQRLAERSTNATKQIEVLVRTIQADTNEAVVSMERSTTDVVGGALLAENAGAALDEIEQVSNQIASLVQNISSSARQQASSAADVTRRTNKLKEIGGQTGRATTATAEAISKLSELATQLRKTVAGFTLPSAAIKTNALSNAVSTPPAGPQLQAKDQAAG